MTTLALTQLISQTNKPEQKNKFTDVKVDILADKHENDDEESDRLIAV